MLAGWVTHITSTPWELDIKAAGWEINAVLAVTFRIRANAANAGNSIYDSAWLRSVQDWSPHYNAPIQAVEGTMELLLCDSVAWDTGKWLQDQRHGHRGIHLETCPWRH